MKKLTFVNKFGPGSNAVTGQNAKELADFLQAQGIEIHFLCLKGDYIASDNNSQDEIRYHVKELTQSYTGKSPVLRLLAGLWDGFRLWRSSRATRSDFLIVMTDPPLLFFWFQLFRRFSKSKIIYWTMDLYPEAFVAGKYISSSNFLYLFFHQVVYRKVPEMAIVLGRQQLDYLEKKFRTRIPAVIVPAGIIDDYEMGGPVPLADTGKITFGYSGNIGEAHDAAFLVALVNALDPERHQMVLRAYGTKAAQVKNSIAGKPGLVIRDYLSLQEIASMDVNVASLLPQWNHICVPSKAVTAVSCGSAILLNATADADNWKMFGEASWLVESGNDYDANLKKVIAGITRPEIVLRKLKAGQLAKDMSIGKRESFQELARFILQK